MRHRLGSNREQQKLLGSVQNAMGYLGGNMQALASGNRYFLPGYFKRGGTGQHVKELLCLGVVMQLLGRAGRHALLNDTEGWRFD